MPIFQLSSAHRLLASVSLCASLALAACTSSIAPVNQGQGGTTGEEDTAGAGGEGDAGEPGGASEGGGGQGGSTPLIPDPTRGALIAESKECLNCHGHDLSGGPDMPLPNKVVAPNLTPDKETGIGLWSDDAIRDAIRMGVNDVGETMCTSMPRFPANQLRDRDVTDLIAFLRGVEPVHHAVTVSCK
jgi:hypothetical protein